ncbi:MAG: DUF2185 domain-containing protein [Clostridiales bacterium]|nr:DUF2185 domain-containing protein [Clostridiales bacterium]
MNSILKDIQTKIHTAIKENLPDVSFGDLEEGGKVYYMNGKNGTEFDWFVNEHLPAFMVFYDDKEKLGAAKAYIYQDGGMIIYLYDDHGRHPAKEVSTFLDVEESDMLRLAVCLRCNADDRRIWDSAIDRIVSDVIPDEHTVTEFIDHRKYYEPSIIRREILGKLCIVSKKITRDGWKVGFMLREEPQDDRDSGWQFMAGDEDDSYLNTVENVELCAVGSIARIDPVIMKYIDYPVGARFVRKSTGEFEEDKNQRSYMEKWK